MDRYRRQRSFAPIGDEGQARLGQSRVALVGCGALGTHIAQHLARAGVGFLRVCDRDIVELDNLQRQVLFDENDVAESLPKAVAAARKIASINGEIEVEPRVVEVRASNVRSLIEDVDLVLDGTDNFATRFLLNEASIAEETPWVYGGVVGSRGMVLPVRPGESACFACLLPQLPEPTSEETCETVGVIGPAVAIVAAHQCAEAMKILTGNTDALSPGLIVLDLWENDHRTIRPGRRADCRICVKKEYRHLDAESEELTTRLCGGNAVRIVPARSSTVDFDAVQERLGENGAPVRRNEYLLRFERDGFDVLLFEDGRAVVHGTEQFDTARSVYRQYVEGVH